MHITAIVPCRDAAAWIGDALDGIEAQTRPPDHVIVVDDGSTDGSVDIVRAHPVDCEVIGVSHHNAAEARCPKAKIVSYGKEADAALEVAFGRADAFLYDLRAVQNHHAKHPDTTFIIRDPVSVEPYAIACRKGDPDTVAWLNLVLHHLKRDGRLEELYAKYGLENVELGN